MQKSCTVLVNYDAFSNSLIGEETTPFMLDLGKRKNGICSPMDTILAYLGYPATYFSGTYPEQHGIWTTFWREPEKTVFRGIPTWFVALMDYFPNFPRRAAKYLLSRLLRRRNPNILLPDVPPKLLKQFGIPLQKGIEEENALNGIPTVFDLLRERDLPFNFINPGTSRIDVFGLLFEAIESRRYRFIYTSTVIMDKVLHYNPIDSAIARETSLHMDALARRMVETLENNYESYDLVIISDHGMQAVEGSIDVIAELESQGLRLGKEYVAFLDSPIARFWADPPTRERLRTVLSSVKHGTILKTEDLARLHLADIDERYGQIIFLAEPGYIFFPNYFQKDKMVKGMHGYDPAGLKDHQAIFVGTSSTRTFRQDQTARIVDVAPTVNELLGLPIPEGTTGTSLVAGASPEHVEKDVWEKQETS